MGVVVLKKLQGFDFYVGVRGAMWWTPRVIF